MIREGVITLETLDILSTLLLNHTSTGFVLFEGELGAGKTTFIKHLMEKLGVTAHVTSPTFSLVQHYQANGRSVTHADLYRVKNPVEIEALGLDFTGDNLLLIEWGDQFKDYFYPLKAKISLSYLASEAIDDRAFSIELF